LSGKRSNQIVEYYQQVLSKIKVLTREEKGQNLVINCPEKTFIFF